MKLLLFSALCASSHAHASSANRFGCSATTMGCCPKQRPAPSQPSLVPSCGCVAVPQPPAGGTGASCGGVAPEPLEQRAERSAAPLPPWPPSSGSAVRCGAPAATPSSGAAHRMRLLAARPRWASVATLAGAGLRTGGAGGGPTGAGVLGGRATTYDAPLRAAAAAWEGDARRVHGDPSTGRVVAAPAELRDHPTGS